MSDRTYRALVNVILTMLAFVLGGYVGQFIYDLLP